jgi:hypothetical protein
MRGNRKSYWISVVMFALVVFSMSTPRLGMCADPYFNGIFGVTTVYNAGVTSLRFNARVTDKDNVTPSSHIVTVTYPDGVTEQTLTYDPIYNMSLESHQDGRFIAEIPIDPGDIQPGVYRFHVIDGDGNEAVADDTLDPDVLLAVPTLTSPISDAVAGTTEPTLVWSARCRRGPLSGHYIPSGLWHGRGPTHDSFQLDRQRAVHRSDGPPRPWMHIQLAGVGFPGRSVRHWRMELQQLFLKRHGNLQNH